MGVRDSFRFPHPFAPSEVEGPLRAKPRTLILGFARKGVSTSLDTNGVGSLGTNGTGAIGLNGLSAL
jgi:hypothetical protein